MMAILRRLKLKVCFVLYLRIGLQGAPASPPDAHL
jgi:hypothetical protein